MRKRTGSPPSADLCLSVCWSWSRWAFCAQRIGGNISVVQRLVSGHSQSWIASRAADGEHARTNETPPMHARLMTKVTE